MTPADVGSSPSSARPNDDDDGFVVVAKPIVTVRQFAQWIEQVRLPSASLVMRGAIEDDVILLLINRRTFINDVLRSFHGQLTQLGCVDDEAWPALWSQFKRDFPREEVVLDGERMDPNLDFDDILPRIRAFVRARVPKSVVQTMIAAHSAQQQPEPSAAAPSSSPSTSSSSSRVLIIPTIAAGVHDLLTLPLTLLTSVGRIFVKDEAPSPLLNRENSTGAPPPPDVPFNTIDDVVEAYTRVVVLLSQQAVLALPLEVINAQFCQDVGSELFVGEVSRDDPVSATAGMRVRLQPHASGATLTVSKVFRVFSLVDSVDYSLFYIDMKVEVDLFSADENITLVWKIIPASTPNQKNTVRAAVVATAEESIFVARHCECLGASSGYHKPNCHRYAAP